MLCGSPAVCRLVVWTSFLACAAAFLSAALCTAAKADTWASVVPGIYTPRLCMPEASANGKIFIPDAEKSELYALDSLDGSLMRRLLPAKLTCRPGAVATSADGSQVAITLSNPYTDSLLVLDTDNFATVTALNFGSGALPGFVFSPSSNYLYFYSGEVISISDSVQVGSFEVPKNAVLALAPQAGSDDVQILGVAEAHHQHQRSASAGKNQP